MSGKVQMRRSAAGTRGGAVAAGLMLALSAPVLNAQQPEDQAEEPLVLNENVVLATASVGGGAGSDGVPGFAVSLSVSGREGVAYGRNWGRFFAQVGLSRGGKFEVDFDVFGEDFEELSDALSAEFSDETFYDFGVGLTVGRSFQTTFLLVYEDGGHLGDLGFGIMFSRERFALQARYLSWSQGDLSGDDFTIGAGWRF